jgi:hypothetical protein
VFPRDIRLLPTPSPACIRHSIRQHTSAYLSIRQHSRGTDVFPRDIRLLPTPSPACIRQHTSAYVSIRQHTSAYLSIREDSSLLPLLPEYVSIRQHTSAYVSIRQHNNTRSYHSCYCVSSFTCTEVLALLVHKYKY